MTREEFVRRRSPSWKELEALLGRVDAGGSQKLSGDELMRLGALYRRLTSDLAYARQRYVDQSTISYLNRLAQRGYAHVYQQDKGEPSRIWAFFSRTFPMVLRRRMRLWIISSLLFYIPAIVAFPVAMQDERKVELLMNVEFYAMAKERIRSNVAVPEVGGTETARVSAEVFTNNVKVAMVAFMGGLSVGIITILVTVLNGLMLGSFAGLFHGADMGFLLWTTVLPHGVCELTAITLATAAGLRLAGGILLPGRLTRRKSIAKAAQESLVLFGGSVFLLTIAGLIEGFLSFTTAAAELKWAVIISTFLFCVFYLVYLPLRLGPTNAE